MNREALSFPPRNAVSSRKVLSNRISALQLIPTDAGQAKLGPLAQLDPGTAVEICGAGYNEKTTKVRVQEKYFFVFLEDLDFTGY